MMANQLCTGRLTSARGPLQASVTLSCLSLSRLCFTNSPLLPLPSRHPWRQGRGILGSSQCVLNSALIQASTSRVCSVLKIPPCSFFSFFCSSAALSGMSSTPPLSSSGAKPQPFAVLQKRMKDEKRAVKSAEVKAV